MFETKDRRVIITGAAQGLGKEFATRLLKSGAKVCISDIDEIKGIDLFYWSHNPSHLTLYPYVLKI